MSSALTVTVSNTGSSTVTLSGSPTVSGTDASAFAISQAGTTCGTSLAASAQCTVAVTFAPSAVGTFSAAVTITDSASNSPQTVTLSGTGTVPAPAPVVSLSPLTLSFGNTLESSTSAPLTTTLTNTGNATLDISGMTITGLNAGAFAIASSGTTCGATLAASSTCVVAVTFSPSGVGAYSADLTFADNAGNSPQVVTLNGTGATPLVPSASLSPTALSFNTIEATTSAPLTTTLSNTGNGTLDISGITIGGTDVAAFTISPSGTTCGTTLAASSSCVVAVTYSPTAVESDSATLTFTDNAAGSPQIVTLSGSGTATPTYTASASPTALSFSNTIQSTTSAPLTTTLTNTGNETLNLSGTTITGTNANAFAITSNTCGTTLAASSSCVVSVTFTPPGVAAYSATLSFADNATGSPQIVTLSGTGTATLVPAASLSPSPLAFSDTVYGSTSTPTSVVLHNTGTGTLNISGMAISGTNASVFAISSTTCGSTLAASAQCTITLTFAPPAIASYSATLTLTDNAGNSPQTVALSGNGVATPTATFSPVPGVFGTNRLNSTNTLPILVKNTSNSPLTMGTPNFSGANPANFAVTGNSCGTTVAKQAECIIWVTFIPTAVTSYSATLNLPNNATSSAQSDALTGSGANEPNSCNGTSTTSPSQTPPTANYAGAAFSGKVMAGSLPVIGASVQVYAAGQSGNGSAGTALLATPLTTDANGSFSVPAGFTCPYSNSVLYAVARGGQAGASGAANSGIVLASVLGLCNSITGSPSFKINEVTTAGMAWSMAQFLAQGGQMGATASNSLGTNSTPGIVLAADTFANLVNPLTGTAPGANFPATGTAPSAKINSAANLLNACTVSSGASSTACTQLYTLTATSAGTPNNTLDAMLNLVRNAGVNVSALYTQSNTSTAYTPSLSAAPTDWSLFVTYSSGGMNLPAALSIDSTGRVWVVNYNAVSSLFGNTGAPVFASGITGNNLENSYGGTVNVNDVEWVANEQSPGGINGGFGSITLLTNGGMSPATYSQGGLNFPISVSFDTSGTAWIVDYGKSTMTLLNNAGTPLSGTSGYSSYQYDFPVAVANDSQCNAYIANQSSNTITFTSADGTINGSFLVGGGPSGVAVDAGNYAWSANYYGNSVGLVSPAGAVLSGAYGFTGGGIDHPQGIAIDGAGTAWVMSFRAPSKGWAVLTDLAGSSASVPGSVLSPTAGWGADAKMLEPFALAIDASGNIWISNFGTNTLTEFVGMAAPVKTPLLGPVRVP